MGSPGGGTNAFDVSDSTINSNQATGGAGGDSDGGEGGNGGDGHGGGLFVDTLSVLTIDDSTVIHNKAIGGEEGSGLSDGSEGQGLGGSAYLAGPGSSRRNTRIAHNFASTSGDNVYGLIPGR
jgi:hypothetical protein